MSALVDIAMVLFLRSKHWHLALILAGLWILPFNHELASSLTGIFIYFWLYSVCRFSAIKSGRFGAIKGLSVSSLVLTLAYSVYFFFFEPAFRAPMAVALAAFLCAIWAAKAFARIEHGGKRRAGFWAALFGFWLFPIGIWYIQPVLNNDVESRP